MTVDDLVKVLDAATKLISALAWPALAAFVLVRYAPAFREFFASLGEFSFKGAGFEASAKRMQAAAALAAAAASRPDPSRSPANGAKEAIDLVQEAVTPRMLRKAARATVLWVDDQPHRNSFERQALEALGITFVLARSTQEALDQLKQGHFNAVISDMGREADVQAGYTLLDALRASGDTTPYIIYAGSGATEHKAEARRRGALGSTNNASELFEYVLQAIRAVA